MIKNRFHTYEQRYDQEQISDKNHKVIKKEIANSDEDGSWKMKEEERLTRCLYWFTPELKLSFCLKLHPVPQLCSVHP